MARIVEKRIWLPYVARPYFALASAPRLRMEGKQRCSPRHARKFRVSTACSFGLSKLNRHILRGILIGAAHCTAFLFLLIFRYTRVACCWLFATVLVLGLRPGPLLALLMAFITRSSTFSRKSEECTNRTYPMSPNLRVVTRVVQSDGTNKSWEEGMQVRFVAWAAAMKTVWKLRGTRHAELKSIRRRSREQSRCDMNAQPGPMLRTRSEHGEAGEVRSRTPSAGDRKRRRTLHQLLGLLLFQRSGSPKGPEMRI